MVRKTAGKLFREFTSSEQAGGVLLIAATVVSLWIASSASGGNYIHFWETELAGRSLLHWINDGLMSIFFLLIGLEVEREFYKGELSNPRQALLPILAAIGGMLVPAIFYLLLNPQAPQSRGFGIPMATDIAFALAILSLGGKKVPLSLKVFLTALAVIDDLGAILVIAIFYSTSVAWWWLLFVALLLVLLLLMHKAGVRKLAFYLAPGLLLWYCMLHSGIHPSIAGVLLAFTIPFEGGEKSAPSAKLQHAIHKPVAYIILPLFAAANAAFVLPSLGMDLFSKSHAQGIAAGLILGKPIGILLFAFAAIRLGWCVLPDGVRWRQLAAAAVLGGIGFTMSVFVTLLAFEQAGLQDQAKLVIILSSLVSAIAGLIWIRSSKS